MNRGGLAAVAGWMLASAAAVSATLAYGWRGLLLAVTVLAFWLLLQFSRAMRALRQAAGRPVGEVPNAVMLNARLSRGMGLPQVLRLTRSLGRPEPSVQGSDADEAFVWVDPGGDAVHVSLRSGRVTGWQLLRSGT